MPRSIDPQKWERYVELLRRGFSRSEAARQVGISRESARKFHAHDPSSSGTRWWENRQLRAVCKTCGSDVDLSGLLDEIA